MDDCLAAILAAGQSSRRGPARRATMGRFEGGLRAEKMPPWMRLARATRLAGAKRARQGAKRRPMQEPTNETIGLLKRRRSLKPNDLIGPGPSAGELETLLTIASRVPDHGKLTPWRFIVFAGAARERAGRIGLAIKLADNPALDEVSRAAELARFAMAPLVIAVVSRAAPHGKIPEWEQQLSAGAVCMNLEIAANALGYGSTWLSEWCAYDRRFAAAIGLAEHERIAGFIHIGRPRVEAVDRPRPALADIVTVFAP
jgi:nitroreductase